MSALADRILARLSVSISWPTLDMFKARASGVAFAVGLGVVASRPS